MVLLGYIGEHSPGKNISRKDIKSSIISAANRISKSSKPKHVEKSDAFLAQPKGKDASMTAAGNIAGAILEGTALTSGAKAGPQEPLSLPTQLPGMQPLDPATMERIRRFEMETEAALARGPLGGYYHSPDCKFICLFLKENLLNFFFVVVNGQDANLTRKVGSCESLHDDVKRFKSSREDCYAQKFGSLDSIQAAANGDEGLFFSLFFFFVGIFQRLWVGFKQIVAKYGKTFF